MRIVTEIPDRIAQDIGMSREEMSKRHLISEMEARYYKQLFNRGDAVYSHRINSVPESGKTKRALILADMHFPHVDWAALDCALDYGHKKGCDTVILNGDVGDNHSVSYFKKDPQSVNYQRDIDNTVAGIEYIREAFPDADMYEIEGNHELRLRWMLWTKAKALSGLKVLEIPSLYNLDKFNIKYVSVSQQMEHEIKPFHIGKLYIVHGHEIRVSYSAVNIPRLYYFKTHVNILVAHHHATQEFIARKHNFEHDGAWSMGALCKLSPEFMPCNNWNHGFAIVVWDNDGNFSVLNKKVIGGRVV